MAPKACRHVSQALRIPDFRRALRHRDGLGCEMCAVPTARANHRSKSVPSVGNSRRPRQVPVSPVKASNDAEIAVQTLKGWSPNPSWDDMYVCITCGAVACMHHFLQHFQVQGKHFVGFHVASKTFWCCPCRMEVSDNKGKIGDALHECRSAFEEISEKQQRRVRSRLTTNPVVVSDSEDYLSSQRSYVTDDGMSSRGLASGSVTSDSSSSNDYTSSLGSSGNTSSFESSPIIFGSMRGQKLNIEQDLAVVDRRTIEIPDSILKEELLSPLPIQKKKTSVNALNALTTQLLPRRTPSPPVEEAMTHPTVFGFSNLGNTCYFNSATQALLTVIHYFPHVLHEDEIVERLGVNPIAATIVLLHQTLIKKAKLFPWTEPGTINSKSDPKRRGSKNPGSSLAKRPVLTVAPLLKEIRRKFSQFRNSYQQDAHELFTSMLWAIDEEIDPPKPSPPNSEKTLSNENGMIKSSGDKDNLVNVFVKTDSGETISLRVPVGSTVDDVQAILAKKLNLNDEDMYLQPNGSRQSSSFTQRSSSARPLPVIFSKLNFVRSLFGGVLITELVCAHCRHRSQISEDAFQVSLPIPSTKSGELSMHDCFADFTKKTELRVEAENGYDCEKCSKPSSKHDKPVSPILRDAIMRVRISKLPRVMVVHLKRLGRLRKVTQHIQFDAVLDVAPYVKSEVRKSGSTLYELIAVIVHKGNKRAGHYVAYVSRKGEQVEEETDTIYEEDPTTQSALTSTEEPSRSWFYISDSLVQSVPFDQVLKCEAYMLFYQQVPSQSTTKKMPSAL